MHRLQIKFLAACEKTTYYESSSEAELAAGSLISNLTCFWKSQHIAGAELKVDEKTSLRGDHIWQVFAPVQGRYKVRANLLVIIRLEYLGEKIDENFEVSSGDSSYATGGAPVPQLYDANKYDYLEGEGKEVEQ